MFNRKKTYPLGIDISDYSLKLVELSKNGNSIDLQSFNRKNLPRGVISEGEIQDEKRAINFLQSLVNNPEFGKINSGRVVACLPESKTFVKMIEINSSFNNLPEAIEAETEKHIPFSMEEIYMDWQKIETKKDKTLVLVGVSPKKNVDQYYNLFTRADLSVESLEIEPVAIVRSLLKEEAPDFRNTLGKNYIIIDLGHVHTTIIMYSRNSILFTSGVSFSGQEITKAIEEKLKIKKNKAEEKKKKISSRDKDYKKIKPLLEEKFKILDQKLSRVLEFYYENFSELGSLESVLLVGGGSHLDGLKKSFTCLPDSVEVKQGDPLIHLNLDKKAREFFKKKDVASNSTAIGLALCGIFNKEL